MAQTSCNNNKLLSLGFCLVDRYPFAIIIRIIIIMHEPRATMAAEKRSHTAYKQLSRVSGQANAMSTEELQAKLRELKLDEQ